VPFTDDEEGTVQLRCGQCGALGPEAPSYEEARAAWNRRLAPQSPTEPTGPPPEPRGRPEDGAVEQRYRIWSREHGSWWRPKAGGYTRCGCEAGIYRDTELPRGVAEEKRLVFVPLGERCQYADCNRLEAEHDPEVGGELREAAWELSTYAASINWDDEEPNTLDWLAGLAERIEAVQALLPGRRTGTGTAGPDRVRTLLRRRAEEQP
jgi:hypothetical protein